MTRFHQLFLCLVAAALAGLLAGCGDGTVSSAPALSPQGAVVANDCRSPDSLSSQRGCRPSTRVMAVR